MHSNVQGHKSVVKILEAGSQVADPYYKTKRLIRVQHDKLTIGRMEFEPQRSSKTGNEAIVRQQKVHLVNPTRHVACVHN